MKNRLTLVALALLLTASLALAQLGATTGTTTVSVAVTAEAGLTVGTGTTTLTESGTNFSSYTGTTSMTYYIRTTASGGSGYIELEVTTDFTPTGGPSVGSPPSTGDALKYSCTVAAPGNSGTATACTNPSTAATSSETSVATFGANARSLIGGNTASVSWTLTNDPKYQTGSYSATVTFTISAS